MWFRRKPKQHPPREGWVVLVDKAGDEVSERLPVVVWGDPHEFNVKHDLTFRQIRESGAYAVRVIDVDGNARSVELVLPTEWRA